MFTVVLACDQNYLIGFNVNASANADANEREQRQTQVTLGNTKNSYSCTSLLPWPHDAMGDDMAFFRKMTRNSSVVMGRKTFASIGRPLPKRLNLIFSREQEFAYLKAGQKIRIYSSSKFANADEYSSYCQESWAELQSVSVIINSWAELQKILAWAGSSSLALPDTKTEKDKVFLIGGADLIEQAFAAGTISEMYLTIVNTQITYRDKQELTPVFIPEKLQRDLQTKLPQAELIQNIYANEKNMYSGKIYKFTFS